MGTRHASSTILLALLTALALGCRGPAPARAHDAAPHPPPEAHYTFAFLVQGPQSGTLDDERVQALLRGHMEAIGILARERSLLVAGPLPEPRVHGHLRGIFIFDERGLAQARELLARDPSVAAGLFAAEVHPWRSSSPLRAVASLAEDVQRERLAADPNATPFEVRPYVLALTRDPQAATLLASLQRDGRVPFHGHFGGTFTGTSLWCLDVEGVEDARARLEVAAARKSLELDIERDWELHPWLATAALTRLPALGPTPPERVPTLRAERAQLFGQFSAGIDVRK